LKNRNKDFHSTLTVGLLEPYIKDWLRKWGVVKRIAEAYTHQTLHDYALDHIQAVAESMGYRIAEINPARESRLGPDIYVVNPVNGKGVIVACMRLTYAP